MQASRELTEKCYVGVPMMAALRLDHRIRYYLWKACSQVDAKPGALLRTAQRLTPITYATLLKFTRARGERLEDPPEELPPIQGILLECSRAAREKTKLSPEAVKYFKQVLLHAEHRLFGGQPNFRDLQEDARFLVKQDWRSTLRMDDEFVPFSVDLVSFKPPPHGGEEVAPNMSLVEWSYGLGMYEHMKDEVLYCAEYVANAGGLGPPVERSLLPLYKFQMPHLEEVLETHLQLAAKVGQHDRPSSEPEGRWPGYRKPRPSAVEATAALYRRRGLRGTSEEDTSDEDKATSDEEY